MLQEKKKKSIYWLLSVYFEYIVVDAKKEKNNRMGRTRDLFKKIRVTKGTFHAKMGSIKDRNGMDLTEAEDIKRDGKNTQKNCTKTIFMTKIIMKG